MNTDKSKSEYLLAIYHQDQKRWTHLPFDKFDNVIEARKACEQFSKKDGKIYKVIHESFVSLLEDFEEV